MRNLKVKILRGKDKIGENLIGVSTIKTKILLECGTPLQPSDTSKTIEDLILNTEYDAIIISHYHEDHSALLKTPLKAKSIYIGESAYKILKCANAVCQENESKINFVYDKREISIGHIDCVFYLCDHSAYDSYMIELKCKNENLLYTGDFRSNGRKSFKSLLEKLPCKVNLLIAEATKPSLKNQTEKDLEEKATKIFSKYDKAFILQSTLNIDRAVSFYRASKKAGKPFIMTKSCAKACAKLKNIPNPITFSDCYVYVDRAIKPNERDEIRKAFKERFIGRSQIEKMQKFTMQINSKMLNYLQKTSDLKNSVLVYSMWQGYKDEMKEFLKGVKALRITTVDLHVSGHTDVLSLSKIIEKTCPDKIELVHTLKEDETLWKTLLKIK